MTRNAINGAGIWIALVVLSVSALFHLTLIELMFLLAPLVVVPLGLDLASLTEPSHRANLLTLPIAVAQKIQLPAALCVVISFLFSPGPTATILTLPWLCFAGFLAVWIFSRLTRASLATFRQPNMLCLVASLVYLPVGCAWLVASRHALTPMNFQEPIVLLTALHFHFAGFAAPLLARAVMTKFERAPTPPITTGIQKALKAVTAGVLAGPALLAAGFVIGPKVKLLAAIVVALSEIGLALFFLAAAHTIRSFTAQLLITVSALFVLFSMGFALIWAVGEFPLQPFLHLREMAQFHGVANALGFTICGLLAWSIALRQSN